LYSPYKVYGVPVALSSIYTSSSTIYQAEQYIFYRTDAVRGFLWSVCWEEGNEKGSQGTSSVPCFIWNGGKTKRPYLLLQTGKHTRLVQAESIFASVVLKRLS
jgi:hypothetical protein